ncbi:MAG: hypothetical protein WCV90_00170 [Candidatus Woesearchaeota archaeon]
MECEETGCTNEATHEWGGKKVCHDHYDKYKDAKEQLLMDLDDIQGNN